MGLEARNGGPEVMPREAPARPLPLPRDLAGEALDRQRGSEERPAAELQRGTRKRQSASILIQLHGGNQTPEQGIARQRIGRDPPEIGTRIQIVPPRVVEHAQIADLPARGGALQEITVLDGQQRGNEREYVFDAQVAALGQQGPRGVPLASAQGETQPRLGPGALGCVEDQAIERQARIPRLTAPDAEPPVPAQDLPNRLSQGHSQGADPKPAGGRGHPAVTPGAPEPQSDTPARLRQTCIKQNPGGAGIIQE